MKFDSQRLGRSLGLRERQVFPSRHPVRQRKATRATLGKASLSSSNRLPSRSGAMLDKPGDIPAWSRQAGNEPSSDWIASSRRLRWELSRSPS